MRTSPCPLGSNGTSRLPGGRCASGTAPITASAAARMRAPERKFVYSGSCVAGVPSAFGNSCGNRNRL